MAVGIAVGIYAGTALHQPLEFPGLVAEDSIRPVSWTWSAIDNAVPALWVCFIALGGYLAFGLLTNANKTTYYRHNTGSLAG